LWVGQATWVALKPDPKPGWKSRGELRGGTPTEVYIERKTTQDNKTGGLIKRYSPQNGGQKRLKSTA